MDLGTLVAIGGLIVTIGGGAITQLIAWGKLNQKVEDQASDINDLKERVERAETAANQIQGLAAAVEHMGERFAGRIEHLVQVFDIQNGHIRSELADIKGQMRSPRARRPDA